MLSIRVSPKPLSTGVIYQGQSEAALSTSSRLQWYGLYVCDWQASTLLDIAISESLIAISHD